MKKKYLAVLLIVVVASLLYFVDFDLDLPAEKATNIESYVQDNGEIRVYFCPQQDCEGELVKFIDSAQESIHCALFDVGLKSVQNVLDKKSKEVEVKVVTDNDYVHKYDRPFVKEDSWGLMHNKFCIIDGKKVSTGSMNPTNNGAHKNNNNLLLIGSRVLASNYEDEFEEMWSGVFKKGNKVLNPAIKIGNITVRNYFCPEDNCAYHVKEELKKAKESIHFMTFSFTHDGIANVLLLKNLENITIKGVMEARQVSKYSKFKVLEYQDVDAVKDGNKNNMHHKVFIIDEETIITGSFNPTSGGDRKNDENLLIIGDEEIAKLFLEEFETVWGKANS